MRAQLASSVTLLTLLGVYFRLDNVVRSVAISHFKLLQQRRDDVMRAAVVRQNKHLAVA